jgi:alpha/beta superfamily hydrolase
MIPERAVTLTVGGGVTLDARLALPPAAPAGVVICHPHPLYGGDMDNPVVVRAAEAVGALGLATLRFNFRGVGASTGSHDNGQGEADDVEAAMAELAGATARVALAGYSFGAAVVAWVAARRDDVAGLALIAPPLAMATLPKLDAFAGPLLVVAGDDDEYCPREHLERLRTEMPRARVESIAGANHFFFGTLFPLGEAIGDWARRLLPAAGTG